MIRVTGVVLRHKRLVVLAWLLIAVAGFATISKATGALSASFSIPGQAFQTDANHRGPLPHRRLPEPAGGARIPPRLGCLS